MNNSRGLKSCLEIGFSCFEAQRVRGVLLHEVDTHPRRAPLCASSSEAADPMAGPYRRGTWRQPAV
jgi:hypothetical protein